MDEIDEKTINKLIDMPAKVITDHIDYIDLSSFSDDVRKSEVEGILNIGKTKK